MLSLEDRPYQILANLYSSRPAVLQLCSGPHAPDELDLLTVMFVQPGKSPLHAALIQVFAHVAPGSFLQKALRDFFPLPWNRGSPAAPAPRTSPPSPSLAAAPAVRQARY